jgi:hypothetical protein
VADPIGTIRDLVEDLSAAHAMWGWRDESKAQPDVRRAANTAMDSIDKLLRELHRLRDVMASEIRQADDATNARVDKLLTERRGDRSD